MREENKKMLSPLLSFLTLMVCKSITNKILTGCDT